MIFSPCSSVNLTVTSDKLIEEESQENLISSNFAQTAIPHTLVSIMFILHSQA
ncbi:MAG: hypothetical protein ACOZBL_00885 [Patescibacteria group bacterium]